MKITRFLNHNIIVIALLLIIFVNSKNTHKLRKTNISEQIPYCREVCEYNNPLIGVYSFHNVKYHYNYGDSKWEYICSYLDKDKRLENFKIYSIVKCKLIEE